MRSTPQLPQIAAILLALTLGCSSAKQDSREDACPAPFETLASGTCMSRPEEASSDLPVVVFLHGMTESASWAKGEGLRLAEEAGEELIVLAPLGRKGACPWSPSHHCWPQTSPDGLDDLAEAIGGDLLEVKRVLGRSEPIAPILVGFSNGAYGATALAFATDLRLGGLFVLNGGATAPIPASRDLPILLRAATGDEYHHPTMVTLRERLAAAGWSAGWEEREGPHALDDSDLASVVRFAKGHARP